MDYLSVILFMMEDFMFYFSWGWSHIISTEATDHLLFLLALTAMYLFPDRKKIIILITAFTIGHSLTLGLSLYDRIRIQSTWVECLIPLTILLTSVMNWINPESESESKNRWKKYLATLFFGLIHGMGFAGTIKMTLDHSQQLAFPLFSFNLGIEAGQVVVVFMILMLSHICVQQLGCPRKWWVRGISAICFSVGLWMTVTRWPF